MIHSPRASAPLNRFVRRLGPHHFAHLRAVSEGLDVADCARRYLGIEHGNEARAAHQQAVDAVRAVARRRGEAAWRLIGLSIGLQAASGRPLLDDFVGQRGLEGFSETEVLELYEETFPPERKAVRSQRLRARQLALLRRLEGLAAETPQASDLVAGWFDDVTASKLMTAGLTSLGELGTHISAGGRWYRTLPAIGQAKARRIASHLATLLPRQARPIKPLFALRAMPGLFSIPTFSGQSGHEADHEAGPNTVHDLVNTLALGDAALASRPPSSPSMLPARNDVEAVQCWIRARAGSVATAKAYQREATRLLLWLQYECRGATLTQMSVADCSDFMAFLQNIPPAWISRERAAPGTIGWAPFRGPLSHTSHRQAITIIASLFTWLQAAQYLAANPWLLVNQKTGDDRNHRMLDTKAFSEAAMLEVLRFIDSQAPSASRARIRFILRFVEAVGLRSAELLQARLGDLRMEPEGWVMQVHGKGARNRIAAVPGQALEALQDYLEARHLGSIQSAPPAAPLLASSLDPMASVGYQALYEHVKSWLARAVRASSLPANERDKLAGATTHWLRHTFGTRAIAREVPLDVIQAQMGHASIQTTTAIYGRAPIRRRLDELGKAFK
jgi:integrase